MKNNFKIIDWDSFQTNYIRKYTFSVFDVENFEIVWCIEVNKCVIETKLIAYVKGSIDIMASLHANMFNIWGRTHWISMKENF